MRNSCDCTDNFVRKLSEIGLKVRPITRIKIRPEANIISKETRVAGISQYSAVATVHRATRSRGPRHFVFAGRRQTRHQYVLSTFLGRE